VLERALGVGLGETAALHPVAELGRAEIVGGKTEACIFPELGSQEREIRGPDADVLHGVKEALRALPDEATLLADPRGGFGADLHDADFAV
jgi:hypothetical protein